MRNIFSAELPGLKHSFGVFGEATWMLLGVHYDAVPQAEAQKHLSWQHHFVDPAKAYIPEPGADIAKLFREMSQTLGRPAIIRAREAEIDLEQLIGLRGEYVAYLARKVICPDDREIGVVIGNTDAFTLWINGEKVTSADGPFWWSPYNSVSKTKLVKGENTLLLKLVKRQEKIRFTLRPPRHRPALDQRQRLDDRPGRGQPAGPAVASNNIQQFCCISLHKKLD